MDVPLSSAIVKALTPIKEGHGPADPSQYHGSEGNDRRPDNPWAGSPEPTGTGGTPERSITLEGGLAIGLQAGCRRYLQGLSWAETDVLNAADLLELLLCFGRSRQNAPGLAAQLLHRFGSLGGVMAADPAKLTEVVGDDAVSVILLKAIRAAVKAIVREPLEDRPVISSASALMDYLSLTMRHEPTEATRILYLDRKNGLLKDEILHRGTIDHTPLYPREVVKRVVELGASAVILVHNHPSGDPTPSRGDIDMTRQLAAALGTINVVLHDHVIVGRNRETSLRKLNLI